MRKEIVIPEVSRNVRVVLESEAATSCSPARVLVYKDKQLVTEIIAEIESEMGADGGFYSVVKLREKKEEVTTDNARK